MSHGKRIVITGGTAGIGLAMAEALIARGARVAVCGRSRALLDAFATTYPDAVAIAADITVADDRVRLLAEAETRLGGVDILINNAGALAEHDFASAPPDDRTIDANIALNLTAPIQLTAEALRRFPALEVVAFVTSGFALVPPTRAPLYGATKAGLRAFAKALRRQGAARGLRVIELLPPAVATRATAGRNGPKVAPEAVAGALVAALDDGKDEVLPGQVRFLPALLRLAPRWIEDKVAQG